MNIVLQPGYYVVAVSGGVDSVSLLHLLKSQPGVKLTIAHFDHGIRDDSHLDRKLVQQIAGKYGLPFVYERAELGAGASEAEARAARYGFLRRVQQATGAQSLVTAHHQDDLLETVVINLLRGTGRKGLSSLKDRTDIRRPLLTVPKEQIKQYAAEQGLLWREDSTNQDTTILRNYVRHILLPRLGPSGRQQLLTYSRHLAVLNRSIDNELLNLLHLQPSRQTLDRQQFIELPHNISREVMAAWLRSHGLLGFDSRTLERLVVGAKTLLPGKQIDVGANYKITLGTGVLALTPRDC